MGGSAGGKLRGTCLLPIGWRYKRAPQGSFLPGHYSTSAVVAVVVVVVVVIDGVVAAVGASAAIVVVVVIVDVALWRSCLLTDRILRLFSKSCRCCCSVECAPTR